MKNKYILTIDQGTTSTRAMLFDHEGKVFFKAQQEVECLFPRSGWVEQNALDLYLSVIYVINDILLKTNLTYDDIDSVGITNQRETTIIWEKETGMPVYNAIVWQSRQSAPICEKWKKYEDKVHEKTGLIINPYFSASKIRFILDNIEDGQERAEKANLCLERLTHGLCINFQIVKFLKLMLLTFLEQCFLTSTHLTMMKNY